MARKAKDNEQKVLFQRLQKVWTDIPIGEWLSFLAETVPEAMFVRQRGNIKGRCPFHEDSTASFIVTPEKGIVKCFGCNKMFWNPITFIAALKKCSFGDAILFVRKRFGLKASIPEALYEKVRDHEVYQQRKAALMQLFSMQLFTGLSAYAAGTLDSEGHTWMQPTIEYLLARRLGESAIGETVMPSEQPNGTFDQYGIWSVITGQKLLGVFPPRAVVENHFGSTSEEFKFYNSYFSKCFEGQGQIGWLVFPLNDEPESICRFKMRAPRSGADGGGALFVDDAYESEMGNFRGFYGLTYYKQYLSSSEHDDEASFVAHLHEGEFDALSAIAQQIRRTSDDFIALSLGGASAQPIDRLLTFNIKQARIVQDRDKGGNNFAHRVMESVKSKTLSLGVFQWPDEYVNWRDPTRPDKKIKDPDDAIKEIGYPRWRRYVNDSQCYWEPHEWCYDQAVEEIAKGNITDVGQLNRVTKSWGALLRDEQMCSKYCDAIAKNYGLDAAVLKRDIRAKDEDEQGFIERIGSTLREKFHPIGVQNAEGRKRLLALWNKESRAVDHVVLNDPKSAETLIARYYGPIYEFVAGYIGDPTFIVGEDGEESIFNVSIKSKRYCEYLNFAMLKLAQGLPVMDHAPTKAQGIHVVESSADHMRSYMVNGRDVWRIAHEGDKTTVQMLDGPSDEGVIFDNSAGAWMHTANKVEDFEINAEKRVDIVDLFLRVRSIIQTGWGFKNQDLDTTFLAAHVMTIAIMSVFTRQTAVILNAEAEAGKSKFTAGLVGGSGFPRINLVAHAVSMQGYTAASIRQKHNNTSLCLCLEEFEDYGGNDAKSVAVRKVLELCRDLISESAVNWSIGTTSGESKTYHLRFPLVASAIRPLRDAASLSRFVQFELVKDDSRSDPVLAILDKFGDELIQKTKHELVVAMLPNMLALKNMQTAVEKEYVKGGKLPAHASSRFREALYPVLSLLKLIGERAATQGRASEVPDYRQFAYDFSESRKEQLARLKTTSENEQIYETILGSAIQVAGVGSTEQMSGVTTIRVMLADLNKLGDVNKTKKGVYFDAKMEWLVVNWIEAMQGVLAQSKYRAETPTFLKSVSERSPFHIPTEQVISARVLERLVDAMGPCQQLGLISVFSVKHLLDATRARATEQTAAAASVVDTPAEGMDPGKAQGDGDMVV